MQTRRTTRHMFPPIYDWSPPIRAPTLNVYGLSEVVTSSGIRRDVGTDGGVGTIETDWVFQQRATWPTPLTKHDLTDISQSHGVFLFKYAFSFLPSSNQMKFNQLRSAAQTARNPPPHPPSTASLIEYRLIGGTLSLYFLSGPFTSR
ncbi:hypothetical protein B0H11DRAFT_2251463 [Mycena galericulata]|nr:hypothetical protein B0H11DRAFT_2251463 [Mycena galericulata]